MSKQKTKTKPAPEPVFEPKFRIIHKQYLTGGKRFVVEKEITAGVWGDFHLYEAKVKEKEAVKLLKSFLGPQPVVIVIAKQ